MVRTGNNQPITCTYCGKEIGDVTDYCPMCGAPVPKRNIPQPPPPVQKVIVQHVTPATEKKWYGKKSWWVAGVVVLFIVIFIVDEIIYQASRPPQRPVAMPPAQVQTEQQQAEVPVQRTPAEAITDPGLRQALELMFRREIHQIGWEEIHQIRTLAIDRENMILSNEAIPLDELENHPAAVRVQPDTQFRDGAQLRLFENLTVFSFNGSISQNALSYLPNITELSVQAGRETPDLTTYSVLPNLQRLAISGRNLESLQGISELSSLYSLRLQQTGLTDLSVLNQQRNVTHLTLINNQNLSSYNTLQEMTWLRGLHIERSEGRSLVFIGELTSLEALTLVRTDTRTYDFILPLVNLRYLRLFDNRDVRDIPSLAGFTQLEELHLDTGRNTGQVRPINYLQGVTSVRRMTFHNPDTLDAMRGMENLEELHISFGWLLTDASALGYLTNLHTLRIYDSRTFNSEVSGMGALARLTNLRSLDISGNDLYFNWDFLYSMTGLEHLNISNNVVVGDFSGIQNLRQLRTLSMASVRLVESYWIQRQGGMVSIGWSEPQSVESFASSLSQLTLLESLNITGNNVRDIGFVADMRNLRYLHAENNYISDVSPLAQLADLTFVNLRRNPVMNWGAVDEMINTTFLGR